MKKLSSIIACALLFGTFTAMAQTADSDEPLARPITTAPSGNNIIPADFKNAGQPAAKNHDAASRATGCGTFLGPQKDDNGARGVTFSVIARQDIIITSLDHILSQDSSWSLVYFKKGTSETGVAVDFSKWTFIDSAFVEKKDSLPVRLPLLINKALSTADTMSFLIFNRKSVRYITGDANLVNTITGQNNFVKVLQGNGINSNLNYTAGRIFTGNVNYCPVSSPLCIDEVTTQKISGGAAGIMFDITATKNISINGLTTTTGNGTSALSVYTRQNGYEGFELDSTKWTLLKKITLNPIIISDSLINIPFNSLDIDSGKKQAFYILCSGGYIRYVIMDKPYKYAFASGTYELSPGTGGDDPFSADYFPRKWRGIVNHCLRSSPNAINETKSLELSLYPNPVNDVLNITTDDYEAVSLDVIDMQGRVVATTVFQGATTLDVAQLPASVYQLYLHNANGTAVKRFVKN